MRYRLCLYGGFSLHDAGESLPLPLVVQKLLAYLALHGSTSRRAIAVALWPDAGRSQALQCLRTALWRLNRVRSDLIEGSPTALQLSADVDVEVDGLSPAATLMPGAVRCSAELLPGWYDEWVLDQRERARQLRLHALERTATHMARERRYGDALQVALHAVETDPLRESAHRLVIAIHRAAGNVTEARRHYATCVSHLRHELGVEPSAQLARLGLELGQAAQPAGPASTGAPHPPTPASDGHTDHRTVAPAPQSRGRSAAPPARMARPVVARSRLAAAAFETLSCEAAVLDESGTIVLVNEAWRNFGRQAGAGAGCGVGANYLRVCERAARAGDEIAGVVGAALTAVLSGAAPVAELDYPCVTPEGKLWFRLRAHRVAGLRKVVVVHDDISPR